MKNDIENISINSEEYTKYIKAWQYALDMTKKELHQSAEGLYHNLNTLQSMAA